MKTKTITRVNNVQILAFAENDNRLVPIKPICEALGVDAKVQRTKINNDELLNSVGVLSTSTGSDGKEYEMLCLPVEYIFGWLFSINPKNVKPEAREFVAKYREECYRVLADHFLGAQDFLKQKQEVLNRGNEELKKLRHEFSSAKKKIKETEEKIDLALKTTIEDWRENNRQLYVFSLEEQKGEINN